MPRPALEWILLAALTAAPATAHAQRVPAGRADGRHATTTAPVPPAVSAGRATAPMPSPRLVAERQRLRVELDRVNGEIDALKHDRGGLRDDYRLRNRMADAEALARRLTEVDARLHAQAGGNGIAGAAPGGGPSGPGPWPAAPQAQPSDDRAALEAKADILADQARRLNGQVDILAARVTALRGREELRRRAGQLEHDPFAQMDQGKRRLATTGVTAGAGPVGPKDSTIPSAPGVPPSRTDSQPPSVVVVGGTTTPTAGAAGPGFGPTGATQTGTSSAASFLGKAQPSLVSAAPASGSAEGAAASVATQFAGILDASTLAEIRRLEDAGSPGSSAAALERAVSALRARAAQLNASAQALRSQAKTAP